MTEAELKELARTIIYDSQRSRDTSEAVQKIMDILRPVVNKTDPDKTSPLGTRLFSTADLDFWDKQT